MSQTAPSESDDSTASKSTAPSLSAELDKLTTAVLEVSDNIQACAQESDARHAAYLARAEEQKQRTTSFQDQIAKMLAMTQEGLRKEREPLRVPNPQKFQRNLQRAAFGTGGDSESASSSCMLESSRDSISAETQSQSSLRESQAESILQPRDYPTGSQASVRASHGSASISDTRSGILSDASSWQEV